MDKFTVVGVCGSRSSHWLFQCVLLPNMHALPHHLPSMTGLITACTICDEVTKDLTASTLHFLELRLLPQP